MAKRNSDENGEVKSLLQGVKEQTFGAFERLLEIYQPLIDSSVAKYSATGADAEDLRQEALVAFYGAALRYDDAREDSATFGQFAKVCIRNGLISALRSIGRTREVLPLDDKSESFAGVAACPAEDLIASEDYAVLNRIIRASLSDYENRIWRLYLSGRTAKEIGGICQKNEKSVQNAICRIRKKLRSVIPNP